jgi:hypothetical protein
MYFIVIFTAGCKRIKYFNGVFLVFLIPIIYQTTAKVLKLPEHPSYMIIYVYSTFLSFKYMLNQVFDILYNVGKENTSWYNSILLTSNVV